MLNARLFKYWNDLPEALRTGKPQNVKANDLEKYRALWHENFVGWPFVSPAPVRKDHITDWITSNTSNGIKLQSVLDRATCDSGNGRHCDGLLSN